MRQKVLTELAPLGKEHVMAVLGRGINETFNGLDIVPPCWMAIVAYDEIPLVCANIESRADMLEYMQVSLHHLENGVKVRPVCVPERQTVRESFLSTMRMARGTEPLGSESDLRSLINNYVNGYVDGVVQYAGFKAAKMVLLDYCYMLEPGWQPGPEWFYWLHQPKMSSEGGMPDGQ